MSRSDWNESKGVVKSKTVELKKVNNYLEEVRSKFFNYYLQLEKEGEILTSEVLKNIYLGKGNQNNAVTLCQLFVMHNEQMNTALSPGTIKNYYTTEKYIKLFLENIYGKSDIFLNKLDFKFISDFEYYLRKNPIKSQDPCNTNGIMKHLERLKKIVTWSVHLRFIKENPFASYKLKFKSFERGYLEMGELQKIEDLLLINSQVAFVRDLFVFGCYSGLSYSDAIALKNSNIETDNEGIQWISTYRLKNKSRKDTIPVCVPLLQAAKKVIEKYKNDPRVCEAGTLFPSISNQEVNRCLKIIAGISVIEKNITFHLARHTFATTITLSNGIPIESVSNMLGHTKISTTQIYAKVVKKKLASEMGALQSRLLLQKN